VFETDVDRRPGWPAVRRPDRQRRHQQPHPQPLRQSPSSPTSWTCANRFVWLGTRKTYDAFTFLFEKTEHGWFQAHAYKFDDDTSTFIVECPRHVWKAHGLDSMSQEDAFFCEKALRSNLHGNALISNARTCAARPSGSASRGW
jgi:hypothetical protein